MLPLRPNNPLKFKSSRPTSDLHARGDEVALIVKFIVSLVMKMQ